MKNIPKEFENGKLPPQAIELEENILGAILLSGLNVEEIITKLKPDYFYKDSHQKIFQAIEELFKTKNPIDILTVTEKLKKNGNLEKTGGPYYITQLTNRVASDSNTDYHSSIIIEKYMLRELIKISSQINNDAYEDGSDIFMLFDEINYKLTQLQNNINSENSKHISEITGNCIENLIIRHQQKEKGGLIGVNTGFFELNKLTHGWQKGDLILIAARPSMGKTAIMLEFMKQATVNGTVKTYELEMTDIKLIDRLIASETHIDIDNYRSGNIENYDFECLHSNINKINNMPIYINDKAGVTIDYICRETKIFKRKHPDLAVIFVDWGGLCKETNKTRNRNDNVGEISAKLKILAKELDIPIVCLWQLSREVERRSSSRKPQLSDLRDSGNLEQDADIVIFLYRPAYYKILVDEENIDVSNTMELIFAKHRDGALDTIKLKHNKGLTKFFDYEPVFCSPEALEKSNLIKNKDYEPF